MFGIFKQFEVKLAVFFQKVDLWGDFCQRFYPALDKGAYFCVVVLARHLTFVKVRSGNAQKFFRRQLFDIQTVKPFEFGFVKNGGGAVYSFQPEKLFELLEGHFFHIIFGGPTEQRDIVDYRVFKVTFVYQIFITRRAVAFAEFVLAVPHNGRHMNVQRSFPPKRVVQQVVFWRTRKVFRAAHNDVYTHQVVVYDVCKVVSRHTVRFDEDIIFQLFVFDGYFSKHRVAITAFARRRHILSNNPRLACRQPPFDFFLWQV